MSKTPYVKQQDRPNLVLVPTCSYEPSPKKAKPNNNSPSTKVPGIVHASEKSALVNNAGVKAKPRVSSVNENVLIDVSKVRRLSNSWATNFLQSIGGTTSKLPRAYNWHSSASKPASLINESIEPMNDLAISRSEMHASTVNPNAKNENIQPKTIKELASSITNTNTTQLKPNNNSSLSNGTNVTTKSKSQCSEPKLNKETRRSIDNKTRSLPAVNRNSSHIRDIKKVTPKAEKRASQPQPTKEDNPKSKNGLTHLISNTKKVLKTKCDSGSTKHGGKLETSRTKVHDKASCSSDKSVHKEMFKSKTTKEIIEKKPLMTQKKDKHRENISRKKIDVDGKKLPELSSDKNKLSKEIDSKKTKSDPSKSRKSTSPIKSVVNKIKHHISDDLKHTNKYESNHKSNYLEKKSKNSDVDLRARLKRRAPNNNITKECEIKDKRKCKQIFPTMPKEKGFVPNENLIISFDTENNTEEVIEKNKPVKTKTRKHESGSKKCKKIKLEINIMFQKDDTTDDESSKNGDKEDHENYNDLSFLDDFNVDEIVESLNDCQSNIVKMNNLINFKESKGPPRMDIDAPTVNNNDAMINNYECLSKSEQNIEINTTNGCSSTLCNEKSVIKGEDEPTELLIKVESVADHNTVAENNDSSELKSKNMLETQRKEESFNKKTDKLSNAVGQVKTEFVENYASNIIANLVCAECCKDLRVTNSNNTKLFESVTLPEDRKSINDNILLHTNVQSEEMRNSTSMQLDIENSNTLQNENTETDIAANIDSSALVGMLTTDENGTLPSDVNNRSKTMSDYNQATAVNSAKIETDEVSTIVNTIKQEDEVILIEDSDNDCDDDMAKVQGTQSLIKHDIIDHTFQKDSSLDTKPKEVTIDTVKLETNITASEPILIFDTDYNELNDYLKKEKEITESKETHASIDIMKKPLIGNSDSKPHTPGEILRDSDTCDFFNHRSNDETKHNQHKSKEPVTIMANTCQNESEYDKIKHDTAKKVTPSVYDKKDAGINEDTVTHNIASVATKDCATAGQDRAQTKNQSQKPQNDDTTSSLVKEQIPLVKETHGNNIKMQVDKSDTTTPNAVTLNRPQSITREHKDDKIKVDVKCDVTDKLHSQTDENDDINITMWLEKKISQDMEGIVKNISDGQENKINKTSTVDENRENCDGHIRMWVVNKGDTRTNTPKTNPEDTKDSKPKPLDNMRDNITPNINAKCQSNETNKTLTRAAPTVNKNTPVKEKQNNTTTLVKGDPRTKQNQPKINLNDKNNLKSKTVNNLNTQNVNAKCQPKVSNESSLQTKANNFGSRQADNKLVEMDSSARKLESRMRQYFGTKYWVTDIIHSGRYSTIYRCNDDSGTIKTVKHIKDPWKTGAFKEGMMMKLQYGVPENNYNCVLYGHGFSLSGHWCHVMEYYPKSLQEAMYINNKSFHIDKVQEFSRQLVAAVTVLRNNNIIHSDINPNHILMNDSETRIKLCGFDQAFYYNGQNLLPNVGTVNYRAPELILGYPSDYGIDVWATALVMYEMATHRQLFPGFYNNDILYKQFCTLDDLPYDIVECCYYRNEHFMGDSFIRVVGSRGEGKLLIRKFFKKERIHSVLFQVYHAEWAEFETNRNEDKFKLNALAKLLNKMLTMNPNCRIAIEFVFADPFIYEIS